MPFMGEKLRYKRMSQGLTIKEVAKKSKTKKRHLEALEKEDVLIFKDKQTIIEILKKYAAVLELDQEEIMEEFEHLWSDSSTAKAYLQKKYKRGSRTVFCGDKRMIAYGAAAVFAALFLSVGGFMIWGGLGLNGDNSELLTYSTEIAEDQESSFAEKDLQTTAKPDEVEDDSFLETKDASGVPEDPEEQTAVYAGEKMLFRQTNGAQVSELSEKSFYAQAAEETEADIEEEEAANEKLNGMMNDQAETDFDQQSREEKADSDINEITEEKEVEAPSSNGEDKIEAAETAETAETVETAAAAETAEIAETDEGEAEDEAVSDYQEQEASVPRTDGDNSLIYTGLSFFVCGLVLLVSTTKFCHNYLSRISTRLLH